MAKFEGRILKVESVDACFRKFSKDCKITFPEKIPVLYNFGDDVIGTASVERDDQGLICECDLNDGLFSENELFAGGKYEHVLVTFENEVTIIEGGRLVSMSILSEGTQADDNLKIERRYKK